VNRTVAIILAILAVLTLGATAATLDTPTTGGSNGTGSGDESSVGSGSIFSLGGYNVTDTDTGTPSYRLPPLVGQVFVLLLALLLCFGLVQFLHEHGVRGVLTIGILGLILMGGFWLLLTGIGASDGLFTQGQAGLGSGESPDLPGGSPDDSAQKSSLVTTPPAILFGFFVVVLLGAVSLILHSTGDDPLQSNPGEGAVESADVGAIGQVAGRAADRIETSNEFDNEIYRAWNEMTRQLDVPNPETLTAAEFARIAVDAGMTRENVDALTSLFEAVRYGEAPPTESREREAIDILRRIEQEHTGAEIETGEQG
jgi:hypothetical protein